MTYDDTSYDSSITVYIHPCIAPQAYCMSAFASSAALPSSSSSHKFFPLFTEVDETQEPYA
jgi:hypothetical protein